VSSQSVFGFLVSHCSINPNGQVSKRLHAKLLIKVDILLLFWSVRCKNVFLNPDKIAEEASVNYMGVVVSQKVLRNDFVCHLRESLPSLQIRRSILHLPPQAQSLVIDSCKHLRVIPRVTIFLKNCVSDFFCR
jgi:hypothetical protein